MKKDNAIIPVYRDKNHIVFRCSDLFYSKYKGKYFVLSKTEGYGYFEEMIETFTEGQLLDEYGIKIKVLNGRSKD